MDLSVARHYGSGKGGVIRPRLSFADPDGRAVPAPRRYELVVVGARAALGMPDDIPQVDMQPLHEPQSEVEGGGELGARRY